MPPRSQPLSRRTHRWLNVILLLPVGLFVSILADGLLSWNGDHLVREIESTRGRVTLPPSLFEKVRHFVETRDWQSDTQVWLSESTMDSNWIRDHDYLRRLNITSFVAGEVEFDADVVTRLIEEHPLRCLSLEKQRNADLVAKELCREHDLSEVYLTGSDLTDVGLQQLPLEQLEFLDISSTRVTGQGLLALPRSQRLTSIALDGRQVDAEAVAILSQLTALRWLTLTGPEITDEQVEMLRPLTNLSRIKFWNTAITPPGIKKLEGILPRCRVAAYPSHEPEE